jgi:hypothetical protein
LKKAETDPSNRADSHRRPSMNHSQNPGEDTSAVALRAELRMSFFLLILFVIHIVEATITFPFVDHANSVQNVVYGFVVAAPFCVINIVFILLTRRDLCAVKGIGAEREGGKFKV